MEKIVLVGYGGHAKSIADCIERQRKYEIVGYTDLVSHSSPYPYLGTDEVLESCIENGAANAVLCLGYLGKGDIRQKLYNRLKKLGFLLPSIIDPSAIIAESAKIDEGVFIGKGAVVNAEAKIGRMAIINTKAVIEHECIVGEFTHVAVGAVLCGQVEVGKAAFIGANATVIQQRRIAEHQIVPAGAVIR